MASWNSRYIRQMKSIPPRQFLTNPLRFITIIIIIIIIITINITYYYYYNLYGQVISHEGVHALENEWNLVKADEKGKEAAAIPSAFFGGRRLGYDKSRNGWQID